MLSLLYVSRRVCCHNKNKEPLEREAENSIKDIILVDEEKDLYTSENSSLFEYDSDADPSLCRGECEIKNCTNEVNGSCESRDRQVCFKHYSSEKKKMLLKNLH